MVKQSIILWTAALIITFLSGYMHSLDSPEYPISSSFDIGLKKVVSFKIDRVYRGENDYKLMIFTDLPGFKGEILWRKENSNSKWESVPMKYISETQMAGYIPHQPPGTNVEYRAKLTNDSTYYIPEPHNGILTFLGKPPDQIMFFYTFTLLLGLFLSVRTGLDYFREKDKIKMLSLFTFLTWVANAAIFNPVKIYYENVTKVGIDAIAMGKLFPLAPDIMLIFWIISTALIFYLKKNKLWALISAIITLVIFQFM
jgi:hypothetical protein